MNYKVLVAALLVATVAHADDRFQPPPAKWLAMGGPGFELCDIGVDAQLLKQGQRNLSISCSIARTAILRQSFDGSAFWDKRIRFSGWVKTEKVEPLVFDPWGGTGLFLSYSGDAPVLATKAVGNTDWQYYELVMDLAHPQWILIGLSLNGKGQVWARDLKFEEVPLTVPVTAASNPFPAPIK